MEKWRPRQLHPLNWEIKDEDVIEELIDLVKGDIELYDEETGEVIMVVSKSKHQNGKQSGD